MSTVYLVRHAAHERVDTILCGRMPGVALGPTGREQAARLSERLRHSGATIVLTSPLERAVETAAPIAAALDVTLETTSALDEIDFGGWTGRTFASLASEPDWRTWNTARGAIIPPSGEGMASAQGRIAGLLSRLGEGDETAVLVGHCDVLRAGILLILGLPLDAYGRFDLDPASITTLALWSGGGKVVSLNERVTPADPPSTSTGDLRT